MIVELLCCERLDDAIYEVPLMLQCQIVRLKFLIKSLLLLRFLRPVRCQFLLHTKFNIVRKKLVLPLNVQLAGAHASSFRLLLVFPFDVLRPHDVINAQHARLRALLLLLRLDRGDMVHNGLIVPE